MKIYLLRHGIATEREDPATDSERPLTKKGRDQMEKIAAALKQLKLKPDVILSSPYVRADQTATILAKELKMKKRLKYTDLLTPEARPQDLIDAIQKDYPVDDLVLVGHYPNMGRLLEVFLGQPVFDTVGLKKGGICCLTVEDFSAKPPAKLDWLLTPDILLKVQAA